MDAFFLRMHLVLTHSLLFLNVNSPYYNIELKEMHVAGKRLKLPAGVFDERHGTVLDSGTTYAYFPKDAFVAFRDAVRSNSFEFHAKFSLFASQVLIFYSMIYEAEARFVI